MAILKRRAPQGIFKKLQEAILPSQGWRRTFHYYRHRVFRTGDSTYKITAGLASGAAMSWSPFIGTHFAQAVFLAWLLRANLLAGFIGTALGNPWTFPFMFWLGYKIGVFLCGLFGLTGFIALPAGMDLAYFESSPLAFINYLLANPVKLLLPLTVGCYLCALACWPLTYLLLYYPVHGARKAYREQQTHRRRKKGLPS